MPTTALGSMLSEYHGSSSEIEDSDNEAPPSTVMSSAESFHTTLTTVSPSGVPQRAGSSSSYALPYTETPRATWMEQFRSSQLAGLPVGALPTLNSAPSIPDRDHSSLTDHEPINAVPHPISPVQHSRPLPTAIRDASVQSGHVLAPPSEDRAPQPQAATGLLSVPHAQVAQAPDLLQHSQSLQFNHTPHTSGFQHVLRGQHAQQPPVQPLHFHNPTAGHNLAGNNPIPVRPQPSTFVRNPSPDNNPWDVDDDMGERYHSLEVGQPTALIQPPCHNTPIRGAAQASSVYPAFKRRAPSHNKLCELVRKHLKAILGRGDIDHHLVSTEEADHFAESWDAVDDTGPPCCDMDCFKIALDSKPRCPWNMSASRIFAVDFLEHHPAVKVGLDAISERFIVRLRGVKKDYSGRRGGTASRLNYLRDSREMTRKNNLFHRRLWVFNNHEDLRRHAGAFKQLGVAGMSSDDSDNENFPSERRSNARPGQIVNRVVLKPVWRSDIISKVLHLADSLYPILKSVLSTDARGAVAHPRIHVDTIWSRSRKFPRKLPRNAYDYSWRMRKQDVAFVVAPTEDYNYDEITRILQNLIVTVSAHRRL